MLNQSLKSQRNFPDVWSRSGRMCTTLQEASLVLLEWTRDEIAEPLVDSTRRLSGQEAFEQSRQRCWWKAQSREIYRWAHQHQSAYVLTITIIMIIKYAWADVLYRWTRSGLCRREAPTINNDHGMEAINNAINLLCWILLLKDLKHACSVLKTLFTRTIFLYPLFYIVQQRLVCAEKQPNSFH